MYMTADKREKNCSVVKHIFQNLGKLQVSKFLGFYGSLCIFSDRLQSEVLELADEKEKTWVRLNIKVVKAWRYFYAPAASACWGHRAFGLSVGVYVCPSIDQVKIFVQGRISRPINGTKLIFHMRMNRYQTNIYISWSTDFGLWPDYQG